MPLNPRVRDNNVFGTVDDNPLAAGATSLNSAGLPNLAAIATKHAVITLDPLRQYGPPEIVVITTHTASATIATMTRGAYGTTPREHVQGTLWVHAPLNEDFIQIATSLTRPLDPYEGQFIFESDTNKLVGYGGVDWAPRDAGGTLGYAQVIASQTGISAIADLTGLSVQVTVGTGRRIKITGHVGWFAKTAGTTTYVGIAVYEGATLLSDSYPSSANNGGGVNHVSVHTPTAGLHTYKLRAASDGTVTMTATVDSPAFILVEDIGAV